MASRVDLDGSIVVGRTRIAADEIELRVTTSGGPGGQHANRTMSRVVVSFQPATSSSLSDAQRERIAQQHSGAVRASSSTHRSQRRNREAALERLAARLDELLRVAPVRRATKPTKASVERRHEAKRRQTERKQQRRHRDDD